MTSRLARLRVSPSREQEDSCAPDRLLRGQQSQVLLQFILTHYKHTALGTGPPISQVEDTSWGELEKMLVSCTQV